MEPFPFLIAMGMIAIVIPFLAWHRKRSRELVEGWANANVLTITDVERRFLRTGPFFWCRSRGQEVFYVVVHDARGDERGAYVRTGGWILGQFSEQVTVRWDDSCSCR